MNVYSSGYSHVMLSLVKLLFMNKSLTSESIMECKFLDLLQLTRLSFTLLLACWHGDYYPHECAHVVLCHVSWEGHQNNAWHLFSFTLVV